MGLENVVFVDETASESILELTMVNKILIPGWVKINNMCDSQ